MGSLLQLCGVGSTPGLRSRCANVCSPVLLPCAAQPLSRPSRTHTENGAHRRRTQSYAKVARGCGERPLEDRRGTVYVRHVHTLAVEPSNEVVVGTIRWTFPSQGGGKEVYPAYFQLFVETPADALAHDD